MRVTRLDLTTLVSLAAPALHERVIAGLAERGFEGVQPSHGYVVQRLLVSEPTIGQLAETLGMTQQGASKQVVALERLGYAERVSVPGDQRRRAVRLTARGRAMVAATRELRAEVERAVARHASGLDVEAAKDVLHTLLDELGLQDAVARRAVPLPRE